MAYFRRIALAALLLLAVSPAAFATGQAEAYSDCNAAETYHDQQGAAGGYNAYPVGNFYRCTYYYDPALYTPHSGAYQTRSYPTSATETFWFDGALDPACNATTHVCPPLTVPPTAAECAALPDSLSNVQHSDGALICMGGCAYEATNAGDGGSVLISPFITGGTGSTCTVSSNTFACPTGYTALPSATNPNNYLGQECIPNTDDADGDGLANNVDPTPFEAGGETKDTDGDGIPDASDSMPNDATNGKGTTASKADNTSSGGGNCSSPPVSHGDAIAAQIAYQTWATRCAVDRLSTLTADTSGSGGGSTDMTATNAKLDALNTKLETGNGTAAASDSKLSGIQTNTAATAANTAALAEGGTFEDAAADIPGEGVAAEDAFGDPAVETGISEGFDDTGFLAAPRTCPDLPAIPLPNGDTLDLDVTFSNFCEFMRIGGLFVLLFASLASIKIYSKVFV